jgi:hypothetical protein
MFAKFGITSIRGLFLALVLCFSLTQVVAPAPAEAQQQTVTLQTICGNINASWPDIAQVYAQILAYINNAIQALLQVGVGVGVGNIQACLPNINIQIPNIDLSGCFNFNITAACNFNAQIPNLQGCLNNALGTLQSFLQQFNINIDMNALLQCLSGLVNVNITIPDLLATLSALLNDILNLLSSLSASIQWYADVFSFFASFCQGYNASGGFSSGFGCGVGVGGSGGGGAPGAGSNGGGYTFNNSASSSGGQLNVIVTTVGGPVPLVVAGPQTAASVTMPAITVVGELRNAAGTKVLKTFNVPCFPDLGKCEKKYKPNATFLKKHKGKPIKVVTTIYPVGGNATNSLPIAELFNTVRF